MIAVLITISIICVLLALLRGPSSKNKSIRVERPTRFSKYHVNTDGWLEMADEDNAKDQ